MQSPSIFGASVPGVRWDGEAAGPRARELERGAKAEGGVGAGAALLAGVAIGDTLAIQALPCHESDR